jgi:hypothetical protein
MDGRIYMASPYGCRCHELAAYSTKKLDLTPYRLNSL